MVATEQNEFEKYIASQKNSAPQAGAYEEKVKYAFTMEAEVEGSLKLLPGEVIEKQSKGFFQHYPSFLLTSDK